MLSSLVKCTQAFSQIFYRLYNIYIVFPIYLELKVESVGKLKTDIIEATC